MDTQELFEKFGRRFAIVDFSDKPYFDFFEIKAVKNEPPIIENLKVGIYSGEISPIRGQDLEICDFEVFAKNYDDFEFVNLAGTDEFSKKLSAFCSISEEFHRQIVVDKKCRDNFYQLQKEAIQIYADLKKIDKKKRARKFF